MRRRQPANAGGTVAATHRAPLEASRPVWLLERYRVPYDLVDTPSGDLVTISRVDRTGPRLLALRAARGAEGRFLSFRGVALYTELADPAAVDAALRQTRESWTEAWPIVDHSGATRGHVYESSDGSVFLPFDLDAPFEALLSERYLGRGAAGQLQRLARRAYYLTKPLIPRRIQLQLRRQFRHVQDRASFPAWPAERSLHEFERVLLGLVEQVAGEPLPWISPWPAPYEWAFVPTHDVEHPGGYAHIGEVRAVERRAGLRSAWYLVPEGDYQVEDSLLESLREDGCEIGLHGLRHDGRDLSPGFFEQRLPAMRTYAERWGARGFRGPATQRDRGFVQELGVDHDSSWCDVARYEPQPGGSCTWLPFFIGEVVELPMTIPMDHTIFEILGQDAARIWHEKTMLVRSQGGMALILTHPDYLLDPARLRLYENFVTAIATDEAVWQALPCEVSDWWRARSLTHLRREESRWVPVGPAEKSARVRMGFTDTAGQA